MKRKGPQRYPTEMIQAAVARLESGGRLADIARELNVPKNTVKYWLDHANKHLPENSKATPIATRIHNRLTRETWDIIFAALKTLRGKLAEATVRDLVAVISELFDRQAQFGALSGKSAIPEKVLEKSEEVRITVQKFLQKRSVEAPKSSLGGPAPERTEQPTAASPVIDVEAEKPEATGAT